MAGLTAFFHEHGSTILWIAGILVPYHIGSAFIGSLDMPDEKSSKLYRFFFKFSNAIAANYSRASSVPKQP